MPAQRAWFHRLDEILETLRGMESTHLDRLTVWEDHLCSERSTGGKQVYTLNRREAKKTNSS